MTRIDAITGLGRPGSGGSAANPGDYPPAPRSALPSATTKATLSTETGVHMGNVGLTLVGLPGNVASAGQIEATDASIIWQAGIDGVEIEWGADGSFNRIYSRYSQPVEFPDRRGIQKAQVIAEEKAKAAIVRFLEQEVATARVVSEVDNDISTATRTKGTSQAEDAQKSTQRHMISSLSEITSSVSAGSLRGVIVLERGYDEKGEQAWVKVGISKKSMGASKALGEALDDDNNNDEDEKTEPGPESDGDPGSEMQRYKNDW